MKKGIIAAGIIAVGTIVSAQANASCNTLIHSLSQRIQHNGVPANEFNLRAVPRGQVNDADGQIIGNCENASYQVVYSRSGRSYARQAPATQQHHYRNRAHPRPDNASEQHINRTGPATDAPSINKGAPSVTPSGAAGNN
ncbi:hypothetical protein LMG33818_000141 [Halomonadaceae bacterium LMG 33818]|uniref:DUF1161 domain-containing protein n=1 Tax=Cernens ardua TaxID=3402176 RepID=UPI003EDC3DBC